jgi:hypothetical protein
MTQLHTISIFHDNKEILRATVSTARPENHTETLALLRNLLENLEAKDCPDPQVLGEYSPSKHRVRWLKEDDQCTKVWGGILLDTEVAATTLANALETADYQTKQDTIPLGTQLFSLEICEDSDNYSYELITKEEATKKLQKAGLSDSQIEETFSKGKLETGSFYSYHITVEKTA